MDNFIFGNTCSTIEVNLHIASDNRAGFCVAPPLSGPINGSTGDIGAAPPTPGPASCTDLS